MDDLLREFLTETAESLESLDVELVRLEQDPNDPALLSNIFRLVHTIKGTCGFLGLPRLEAVAHAGENVLGRFRDGALDVTPEAVSLILESLDTIKSILATLEETEAEPEGDDSDLIARLNKMAEGGAQPSAKPSARPTVKTAAAKAAPAPAETAPLIERVGGVSAIDAAVELLFRKVQQDAELAPMFEETDLILLQGRQVEVLVSLVGGPKSNAIGELASLYAPAVERSLSEPHFDRLIGYLQDSLATLDVPADAVDEVLTLAGTLRDVVLNKGAHAAPPKPKQAKAAGDEAHGAAGGVAGGADADEARDAQKKESSVAAQSVRVGVDLLENLMTMVSELVLSRNQLLQMVRKYEDSEFSAPLQRLSLITTDLQEGVMKTRMQAIGNAWSKLPRIVRDLSHELGKKIELDMRGAETELDRQVLEMIKDPLTHMVRNSADHGIERPEERAGAGKPETGRILLNAYHEGGHIIIEIADDGRGINLDRVRAKAIANGLATEASLAEMSDKQIMQFIFRAGFSTAEKVTNVSGRGVGMDVVRTNIEKIGGHVEMKSESGKGSTFVVKIPLTLAIVSALIVSAGGERFAIPQIGVDELVRVTAESEHKIETINDTRVLRLRNRLLPLVALDEMLKIRGVATADDKSAGKTRGRGDETCIVVARVGTSSFGIIVDQVFESEEIVVKPVTPVLRGISIFSGNTILGDGSVIMILDPNGVAAAIGESIVAEGHMSDEAVAHGEAGAAGERTTLLVFRAGGAEPLAVPLALVARLEEIDVAKVEEANGQPVVQYRGQLMPLVAVGAGFERAREGRQQVIVFSDGDHSMGLMVNEIVDIVEDRLNVELASKRTGVIGTAVVAGRATEVIDAAFYLEQAFGDWFRQQSKSSKRSKGKSRGRRASNRILLVDDSPFFRNLLTPLLSVAGYEVTAVEDAEHALALRDSGQAFDVIISDIEMPGMDGFDLARTIRESGAWKDTPLLALSAYSSPDDLDRGREVGFTDYIAKLDRDALLQSLSQTLSSHRGAA